MNILILGATSTIARALAAALASEGADLFLAARDLAEVERIGRDLTIRFPRSRVVWGRFEATDYDSHTEVVAAATTRLGPIEGVVVAFGLLGDQRRAEGDFGHAHAVIDANFTAAASVLTHLANYLEGRGRGFIVGITSVAGDRGRRSNYVYGAAKGALERFLQGLRHRLAPAGVEVLVVKPGYVDTPMTFGRPGLFLVARPERVADDILRALRTHRHTVYAPSLWFWVMWAVRAIPEPLFQRLKL